MITLSKSTAFIFAAIMLCPDFASAIQCYVGSNKTSTLQSTSRFSKFKTCQIITQTCPYPLEGGLCTQRTSYTEVIVIETVKAYTGSGGDCVTLRKAYQNVEWPIFGIVCCDSDKCNMPFGANDTVFDTSKPTTGNLHPMIFGPKLGDGPIQPEPIESVKPKEREVFKFDDNGNGSSLSSSSLVVSVAMLFAATFI